jgi:hypothetical protein
VAAESILTSTKKILGIAEDYTAFDTDIMIHINSVFSVLNQLGIGPVEGFMIEDAAATWDAFIGDDPRLNSVKTYVYLRVRVLFDPPATSFHINALQDEIKELEWRLNVKREDEEWVDPNPVVVEGGLYDCTD